VVELGDLVVELEQPGRERLAGDLRCGDQSRNASRSGRHAAQLRSSRFGVRLRSWSRTSSGAPVIVLRSVRSVARRHLTAVVRVTRSTRSASMAASVLGDRNALAAQRGLRGGDRVQRVVLAVGAPQRRVGPGQLEHRDPGQREVTSQARAEAAALLDADAQQLAVGAIHATIAR